MTTLHTQLFGLVLAAAILGATASPVVAAFDTPVDLSALGKESVFPEVAIDDAGNSLAVWRRAGVDVRVQARFRNFAGTLGAIENISAAGVDTSAAKVAMDADGDALIVWSRPFGDKFRIQARFRASGGALGQIVNLSRGDEYSSGPVVRMTPNGRALVVWRETDGGDTRIKARAMSPSGTWGAVEEITDFFVDTVASPIDAALNENAKGMIVWSDGNRLRGRTRAANGQLGSIKNLSSPGGQPYRPVTALDQEGDVLVAWEQVVGSVKIIRCRFLSSTGTLDQIQNLSPADDKGASQAIVVVQRDGDAIIAWSGLNSSSQIDVRARIRTAFGQLGPVLLPSAPNTGGLGVRVAAGESNRAVVLWRRPNVFSDYFYESRILFIGSGEFKPTVVLSAENPDFALDAAEGEIVMNPSGAARVVWQRDDDDTVVQLTSGP